MTVRNLNTTTDYATWTLAIAGLAAPLVADTVLEDQDGATYTEKVSLDSRNMGGFTLTLRRKTGVAKPTISYGADFEAVIRVSNTIGIILDGLVVNCGSGTSRKDVQVGPDGAGGAAGANTVTVQNCDFGGTTTGAEVDLSSYGAGNTQIVTVNDCTFSGSFLQGFIVTGVAASITIQFNRSTTTGTLANAGRAFDFTGGSNLTANVTRLFWNTGTALLGSNGYAFTLNAQTRTIFGTVENCRFYGLWDTPPTIINSSSGTNASVVSFCTFVNTHTTVTAIMKFANASGNDTLSFQNNILSSKANASSGGAGMLNLSSAAALTGTTACDYNLFYLLNTTGNNTASGNGTDYATLAAWQAATVFDDHSKEGSPSFTNYATGDLHIPASSLAAGAGITLVGVTVDLDGLTRPNPPAIGAYEPVPLGVPSPVLPPSPALLQRPGRYGAMFASSTGRVPAPSPGSGPWWPFQEDVN